MCHLEARQLVAVVHIRWLDLRRFTVQVGVIQSFHLAFLIPEAGLHFLSGHGSGQVLPLVDKNTIPVSGVTQLSTLCEGA